MTVSTNNLGGYAELSALLGVTVPSLRTIHGRAVKNRAAGTPSRSDLPAPVQIISYSPIWNLDEIREWDKTRPNRTPGWKRRNEG